MSLYPLLKPSEVQDEGYYWAHPEVGVPFPVEIAYDEMSNAMWVYMCGSADPEGLTVRYDDTWRFQEIESPE